MAERDVADAVEIVRRIMDGDYHSDNAIDRALKDLRRLVPDPNVHDLIYWPDNHDRTSGLGRPLTPEQVVDLAMKHRPIEL